MAVAETNKIITHGDGQSIATSIQNIANAINDQEKNVHLSDAQTITGAKTFSSQVIATGGVKTDKVTSTNGTEVLAYNGTTTALNGKADRPTYNGGDLALKSDVDAVSDVYMLAEGDWSSIFGGTSESIIFDLTGKNLHIYDRGTMTSMYYAFCCLNRHLGNINSLHFKGGKNCTNFERAFSACVAWDNLHGGWAGPKTLEIEIDASSCKNFYAFLDGYRGTKITSLTITNIQPSTNFSNMFTDCARLTEIPAVDLSNASSLFQFALHDTEVTSFLCTGMKLSFDLSSCTKMDQAALRVVIDNLADVSELGTSPTLTLGSTLLAKLTADDITTANNKGWNLA